MNIFKKIVGKSIVESRVVIMQFSHNETLFLSRKFESKKEAEAFYYSIELGDGNAKGLLKMKFCNHEHTFTAKSNELHYYECCTSCGKATFVNNESREEYESRMKETELVFLEYRISRMEKEIEHKQDKLRDMKIIYNSKRNES